MGVRVKTPCELDPRAWDLDVATVEQVRQAQQDCLGCPLLIACTSAEEANRANRKIGPTRHMVRAGFALNHKGKPMTPVEVVALIARRGNSVAPDAGTATSGGQVVAERRGACRGSMPTRSARGGRQGTGTGGHGDRSGDCGQVTGQDPAVCAGEPA